LIVSLYFMMTHYLQSRNNWNRLLRISASLGEGDLTVSLQGSGQTENKGIVNASNIDGKFNRMITELSDLVRQIRSGADRIAATAKEIASGNVNLSQRTEEQASALGATAAGMEEFSVTVKQNAQNCKQAKNLVGKTNEVAVHGGEMVHKLVDTMALIEKSSKKIVDIVGTIEGITFQTNILALNAAVDAARAGEQGKGFGVVASEVRSLAQRSAEAAKEIKALIEESVGNVEQGGKLVNETGQIINDVVASVQQVTHLIGEIATASEEQDAGVEEINRTVSQMDSVTQQNAALAEEATAAAMQMETRASDLAVIVNAFKVAGSTSSVSDKKSEPVAVKPVTPTLVVANKLKAV
jgi:methyl-accepting chemotaxis protein